VVVMLSVEVRRPLTLITTKLQLTAGGHLPLSFTHLMSHARAVRHRDGPLHPAGRRARALPPTDHRTGALGGAGDQGGALLR
jgi:hypothetical protein